MQVPFSLYFKWCRFCHYLPARAWARGCTEFLTLGRKHILTIQRYDILRPCGTKFGMPECYNHLDLSISRLASLSSRSSDMGSAILIASMSNSTNLGLLFLKITVQPVSSVWRTTLEKFWLASVMDTICLLSISICAYLLIFLSKLLLVGKLNNVSQQTLKRWCSVLRHHERSEC